MTLKDVLRKYIDTEAEACQLMLDGKIRVNHLKMIDFETEVFANDVVNISGITTIVLTPKMFYNKNSYSNRA
jgi:hypothetical protein